MPEIHGGFSRRKLRRLKVNELLYAALKSELERPYYGVLEPRYVDLGAGSGHYVDRFLKDGFDFYGIDASAPGNTDILYDTLAYCDLAVPAPHLYEAFTAGICIEVGEHIPCRFEPYFLDNLANIPTHFLIMSWAVTQRGHKHVNVRSTAYVVQEMVIRGWRVDDAASQRLHWAAGKHFRNRLVALERKIDD